MKWHLIYLLSLLSLRSIGQISVGLIAEPTLNITSIAAEPRAISDSLKSLKTSHYTVSIGIELRKNIDRYQSFSIIPGYHQTTIATELENLQFLDVIHPELPEIRDLAFAANKRAKVRYRHHYLGAQFLYNRMLQMRSLPPKINFYLGGGFGMFLLFSQDAKVTTEGFSIQGKYKHIIKNNIGIDSRSLLLQGLMTADFTYEIQPNLTVLAGLKVVLPMTPTTSSPLPKMTVWSPALRLGVMRVL